MTDGFNKLIETMIGNTCEFFIGSVLNRVRYPDDRRLKAKLLHLGGSRIAKRFGGNHHTGQPSLIEFEHVMQTARRTGTSVREGFDNSVGA